MTSAILHLARWLAWHLGDGDRPADCPPARITVFSTEPHAGRLAERGV